METIIIQIDNKSKDAKTLLSYLQNLSFVKVVTKPDEERTEKEFYNKEFVKQIRESESQKSTRIPTDKLWENL